MVSNGVQQPQKMTKSSDNGFESGDGWDVEDEVEIPDSEEATEAAGMSEVDFEAICPKKKIRENIES